MSEGGRRRCTESVTCRGQSDIQLIISGNCPARGVLSACESTLVVIRSGRVAERAGWQEGRRGAPCVEPKRRATTGVAASRRCTSLVDRRGRELGGGSSSSGGGRQVTEGFSRAARQAERPTASSPHLVVSSWWRHGTAAPRTLDLSCASRSNWTRRPCAETRRCSCSRLHRSCLEEIEPDRSSSERSGPGIFPAHPTRPSPCEAGDARMRGRRRSGGRSRTKFWRVLEVSSKNTDQISSGLIFTLQPASLLIRFAVPASLLIRLRVGFSSYRA